MKVAILLIAIAFAFADDEDDLPDLPYFDRGQLSETFRRYEVSGCSEEVNNCLREIHQTVGRCTSLWKQQAGARYDHCIANDPVVVNASRGFQQPSQKWHKAMDECLAGSDPPTPESLQSLAIEAAMMAYFDRMKRSTTADDVTACWRDVRQKNNQCKQKATGCTQFAHCYGEGPDPSNDAAKRWYNYVRRLRNETKQKAKLFTMHMGHCLRNEPHTDHQGHGHHGAHGGGHHRTWD